MGVAYATAGMNTGVRYAISNLGDLLTRMKATPDGAGNLLDNSCVYTTSCTSESQTHSPLDFPVLVAGKAGGKLKGDQHIRLINKIGRISNLTGGGNVSSVSGNSLGGSVLTSGGTCAVDRDCLASGKGCGGDV